jgi:Domain of unknown function (DUF4160)
MPTLRALHSIKIVYSRDHLSSYFHALYTEYEILITIKTLKTYAGALPVRQHKRILEWVKTEAVKNFLLANFKRLNPNLRP